MALIFSDVDGTLLGDGGRCELPATVLQDAFEHHTVVLASSRDTGELHEVQQLLGLRGALVAEDGAVVSTDAGEALLGSPRAALMDTLRGAMTEANLRALLAAEPANARRRLGSVLIPVELATPALQAQLAEASLRATPGGRWATITGESSKGTAAGVVAAQLGVTRWAAIGNAQNDFSLLGRAAQAFVIRNADGHDPLLATIPGVVLLTAPGPDGWLEMLDRLEQHSGKMP